MELTSRDSALLEDLALHQVMTRDQIIALGYFTSIPRANARLKHLLDAKLLSRIAIHPLVTARQSMYVVTKRARPLLDPRIAAMVGARSFTVKHIDHCLMVVAVRILFGKAGAAGWHSEPQVRHRYTLKRGGVAKTEDVRPDGLVSIDGRRIFIEVDRGNVALARIREKLASFDTYVSSGMFAATYPGGVPALLIVTTGARRRAHVLACIGHTRKLPVRVLTLESAEHVANLLEVCTS